MVQKIQRGGDMYWHSGIVIFDQTSGLGSISSLTKIQFGIHIKPTKVEFGVDAPYGTA